MFTKMAHDMRTFRKFWILGNTWNREILAGTNSCFTSAAPRCIAVAFPFHTTMGNDGTQQHHEHPLSGVAIQAILSYYIHWQNVQSATQ
jgi:hypothetical protein